MPRGTKSQAGKATASQSKAGKATAKKSLLSKSPIKKKPIVRKNSPECDERWSKPNSSEFVNLKKRIKDEKYTDIVTVGPAGFKPLHDGHLKVIEKAFIEARTIKSEGKNVLVLINTSCAGRSKGSGFKIPRGKMYKLWKTFIDPILVDYSKVYGVDYAVSFAHDGALKWLKETGINIYSIYSVDNKDILSIIFGQFVEDEAGIQKFGNVIGIELPRDKTDGLSGTKAREYLDTTKETNFLTLTKQFPKPVKYFKELRSGGGRKAKTVVKRKAKTAKIKAKRNAKTLVKKKAKTAKLKAKRKAKTAKLKAKRNSKTLVKKKAKTAMKRKAKTVVKKTYSKKKSKINNNSNIVLKKGYCEATILDENEPDDPCDIHTSENECLNETRDSDYWRSYDCKWKN